MFEHSLKNAFIWEYHEYSYTFQWKTIDQVYADGWTKVWNQTPSIDSTWLTTNYAVLYCPLQFTFANSNKVVMEVNCKLASSWSSDFVVWTSSSANSWVNICQVYNSYNNYNDLVIGGNSKWNFSHSSNWIVTYTWTLDLEWKTATLVYSDGTTASPSSWSITDTEVTNIRTNGYAFVSCGGTPRAITVTIKSY